MNGVYTDNHKSRHFMEGFGDGRGRGGGWLVVNVLGLTALRYNISVYIGPSLRERGRKKREMKMSKAPYPPSLRPTAILAHALLSSKSAGCPALAVYPAPSHYPITSGMGFRRGYFPFVFLNFVGAGMLVCLC